MLLERTILQLDVGPLPPDKAVELGQLGYLQWLGALPGHRSYRQEVIWAHASAAPFMDASPAVAVFCSLLNASIRRPLEPLPLALSAPRRRGGARARRARL